VARCSAIESSVPRENVGQSIPKLDICQFKIFYNADDRHADNSNTTIRASQISGVRLYSRQNIKIV